MLRSIAERTASASALVICARNAPELGNACCDPPTRKQPTPNDARACGLVGCLFENASDAFLCLFPASKVPILGMLWILALARHLLAGGLQPFVDPFALDEDASSYAK